MTAAKSTPGNEGGSPVNRPSRHLSFAEDAIRAEIRVLRRQLRELYEMGGPVTAQEAGLQSEEAAEAAVSGDQAFMAAPRALRDAEGYDLRPDPLAAQTPAGLMSALHQFRTWAGDPSFRTMSDRSNPRLSASTLCTALSRDVLPTLAVVQAVVTSCGGNEEDQRRFTTAWRRLRLGHDGTDPNDPQRTGGHAA
jgi:hypothetical protein